MGRGRRDFEDFEDFYEEDFRDDLYSSQIRIEDLDSCGYSDESYINSLFERNNIVGFYKDEEHARSIPSTDGFEPDEIEEHLRDYLKYFSKEERDFIMLNFVLGKSQVELMELFGKTQPALCNDSNRIKKEIHTIEEIRKISPETLKFLISEDTGLNYFSRDVLLVFFYSMSVTKTAKIMGVNPMLCRARIESSIKALGELGYDEIYGYFQYILDNLNKIKRTVVEEFEDKKTSRLDYSDGHLLQEFSFDEQ